jgi:hypothetical protein
MGAPVAVLNEATELAPIATPSKVTRIPIRRLPELLHPNDTSAIAMRNPAPVVMLQVSRSVHDVEVVEVSVEIDADAVCTKALEAPVFAVVLFQTAAEAVASQQTNSSLALVFNQREPIEYPAVESLVTRGPVVVMLLFA